MLLHRLKRTPAAVLKGFASATSGWCLVCVQVYVYFAGACVCLLTSGVCHLLGCCQRHVAEMVWRFDYAGIAVLIVTSFVPAMYYAFLCQPFWRNFYLITTVSMGESCSSARVVGSTQTLNFTVSMGDSCSGPVMFIAVMVTTHSC